MIPYFLPGSGETDAEKELAEGSNGQVNGACEEGGKGEAEVEMSELGEQESTEPIGGTSKVLPSSQPDALIPSDGRASNATGLVGASGSASMNSAVVPPTATSANAQRTSAERKAANMEQHGQHGHHPVLAYRSYTSILGMHGLGRVPRASSSTWVRNERLTHVNLYIHVC